MSKEIIKCTDVNIKDIVKEQIELLGNEADLNHLDVSNVSSMSNLFYKSEFNGDISRWNVSSVTDMTEMFGYSEFNQDISKWSVSSYEIPRLQTTRNQSIVTNPCVSNYLWKQIHCRPYRWFRMQSKGSKELWLLHLSEAV